MKILEPARGSKMEQIVDDGMVREFRQLTPEEAASWRKTGEVREVSPEGRLPVAPPEERPRWVPNLTAAETYEELLGRMWSHMRRDKDSYQRTLVWLRDRVPNAVGHMTDQQLFDHLEMLARRHTERALRKTGRSKPAIIG